MHNKKRELFEFAEFRLDVEERRLSRAGEPLSLPPRVFDLLVFLVRRNGHLATKEELFRELWPGVAVEESNLTVNVSALRRVVGAKLIETVSKSGYRFAVPVTRVAPAEEHAPDASPLPLPSVALPSIALPSIALPSIALPSVEKAPQRTWTRWAVAAIALTAVAAGAFYFRPSPAVRSIAVLPFTPPADAPDNYLGLSLAEAVNNQLNGIGELRVPAQNAALPYAAKPRDVLAAGKTLGVDAVVDGMAAMEGNQVRITARLLRTANGEVLWQAAFHEEYHNIFRIEDAIAGGIARAISLSVPTRRSPRGTASTEAYRLYTEGQFLASRRLNEATVNAIDAFGKAIFVDPNYPEPYAAMSLSLLFRAGEGLDATLWEKAKTAALKASNLNDRLTESHMAMGQVLMRSEWDFSSAERAFRRALELDGRSSAAHAALATSLTAMGRHDEAVREMRAATLLEPTSVAALSDLAWTLEFARHDDESLVVARMALQLDAWSYPACRQLAKSLMMKRQYEEAAHHAKRALDINGGRRRRVLAEYATVLAAGGRVEEAKAHLKRLVSSEGWEEPLPSYEMAVLYVRLGDRAAALGALQDAIRMKLTRVIWLKHDPELDPLRSDARFPGLLESAGFQ